MAELQLSPKLIFLTRDEWDDSGAPRLGQPVPVVDHTEAYQHHTVGIDSDATPNQWGSLLDCKRRMRFLRTVRPDLGEDIPYNDVSFLMEKQFLGEGGLVVCEGRGPGRRGAHTKYHNRTGYADAIDGNLEDFAIDLTPWLPQMSRYWGWTKYEREHDFGKGVPNLGTVHPHDAEVWGHQQSGALTACPGIFMMSKLPQVTIEKPLDVALLEDETMPAFVKLNAADDDDDPGRVWVITANTKRKLYGTRPDLAQQLGIPQIVTVIQQKTLDSLIEVGS